MPGWFGMRSYAWGGEQFRVDSVTVPKSLEGVTLTLRALGNGRYELFDPQQQKLLVGTAGTLAEGNGVSLLVTQLVARPGTEFYVTRANQLDAVMGLAGGLQVSEKGRDTGIVQLSYTGVDPKFITAITNAVAQSYLRQRTERAQEEASKMLNFLNGELPHLRDGSEARGDGALRISGTRGFVPANSGILGIPAGRTGIRKADRRTAHRACPVAAAFHAG